MESIDYSWVNQHKQEIKIRFDFDLNLEAITLILEESKKEILN